MIDFFDIPMDGIQELSELDEYLAQPIEKCRDPIAWWWDHRDVLPRLSAMAFDYLSIPCMFFTLLCFLFVILIIGLFQLPQPQSKGCFLRDDRFYTLLGTDFRLVLFKQLCALVLGAAKILLRCLIL